MKVPEKNWKSRCGLAKSGDKINGILKAPVYIISRDAAVTAELLFSLRILQSLKIHKKDFLYKKDMKNQPLWAIFEKILKL
jgi:hypothetical protein